MQRNIVNDGEEEEEENEILKDEIIAINSIYGEDTIRPMIIENNNNEKNIYILHLPHEEIWLKIQFAPTYPYCSNDDDDDDDDDEKQQQQQKEAEQKKDDKKSASLLTALPPIRVLGTHGCGPTVRKGDATRVCHAVEQFARKLYRPGDVYLFDIIEELMNKGIRNENNDENSNNNNNNHVTLLQSSHTTEKNKSLPSSDNETEEKKKTPLSNLLGEKENVNSILTSTISTTVASTGLENVNYKKAKEKSKNEDDSFYSFTHHQQQQQQYQKNLLQTPTWFISEPIRELKSLFLAHCTHIHSIDDVSRFLNLLLDQEDASSPSPPKIKKLASATHNIMAWRICYSTCANHNHNNNNNNNNNKNNNDNNNNDKNDVDKMDINDNLLAHPRLHNKPPNKKLNNNKQAPLLPYTHKKNKNIINNGNTFTSKKNSSSSCRIEEDYDDDGESAAGARLLHLLRLMDICNVLVIVSRWYGGIHLGPRRFALINSVARDAILKATTTTTTTITTTSSSNSDL